MNKKLYVIFILLSIFITGCSDGAKADSTISDNKNIETGYNKSSASDYEYELTNNYSNFKELNLQRDDINIKINNSLLNFSLTIYIDKNRYYLPLNDLILNLNGSAVINKDSLIININNKQYSISLTDKIVKCPDKEFTLKEDILNAGDDKNNIYYISFYDLANMFNMYSRWDKDSKTINCRTMDVNSMSNNSIKSHNGSANLNSENNKQQIGLIRLEDVCATCQAYHKDYFEDLRIIGDYLYDSNIPFHIAWIPRYINPSINVDNDPMITNNFMLAEMIYSLDYLHDRNGTIGLHGYTHQYGNFESGAGFEFGRYEPSTEVFKEKIEKSMETARYLNISIDFFEVPHYEITPEQNKIAEQYFKILYYPFNDYGIDKADLTKPQISPYNNSSLYISTPLDYIAQGKEEESLTRIENINPSYMGSVFFHPALEQSFITLSEDSNGCPIYTYNKNSTLKRLVKILSNKDYRFISVKELIK